MEDDETPLAAQGGLARPPRRARRDAGPRELPRLIEQVLAQRAAQEAQAALWQLADRFLFRGKIAADVARQTLPVRVPLSGAQTAQAPCPACEAPQGGPWPTEAATVEAGHLHLARVEDASG
jgi:hypothetical protein